MTIVMHSTRAIAVPAAGIAVDLSVMAPFALLLKRWEPGIIFSLRGSLRAS